jgi:hypothetical protein
MTVLKHQMSHVTRRPLRSIGVSLAAESAAILGANVAAKNDLAVRCYGDDEMGNLPADLLQTQADKGTSFGQHFFEGSDDICHRSSLWQVFAYASRGRWVPSLIFRANPLRKVTK